MGSKCVIWIFLNENEFFDGYLIIFAIILLKFQTFTWIQSIKSSNINNINYYAQPETEKSKFMCEYL